MNSQIPATTLIMSSGCIARPAARICSDGLNARFLVGAAAPQKNEGIEEGEQ